MKKRVFILSLWMNIDGVSASLLSLLKELDYSKVDVDLALQYHIGPWMDEIPRQVHLLPKFVTPRFVRVESFVRRVVKVCYYWIFQHRRGDFVGNEQLCYAFSAALGWYQRKITSRCYDLALIFGGNPDFARRVDATVKAAWVHEDWSAFCPIKWLARRQFRSVQYVVHVSEQSKRGFDRTIGIVSGTQSIVIENVISPQWIRAKQMASASLEIPNVEHGVAKVLSVGRVCPEKNFKRAIEAAHCLKDWGVRFKWLIVGGDAGDLQVLIDRLDVADVIEFVGKKKNVYPYYRWTDIYVCTSDTESKGLTLCEAMICGKSVVSTRYPAVPVVDGKTGLVVDFDSKAVATAVRRLIDNQDERHKFERNCKSCDFLCLAEIDKILQLM